MNVPPDWWRTFFTGITVDMWLQAMSEEATRAEVNFLEKVLRLAPHAKVLDVPCGGGRHSLEFAARGYQMTGVDFAPEFLAAAKKASAERQLSIAWEQREMRDLPWVSDFDGAFCFGNSFGYLDDAGNVEFLKAVARSLKPGARFLLETGTAAESALPNIQERSWYELGDILFLIHNHHDHVNSRLNTEMTFVKGGKVEKRATSQRIYSYSELCRLLTEAGFADFEGYGSVDEEAYKLGAHEEPFKLGALDLLLVGRKNT
jgi:SAM-dependent methyltransferase